MPKNLILNKNLFNRGLNINISIKICDTALVHNLKEHIIVIHFSIVITATKVCLTDPIKCKYPVIRHLKNDIVRWPIHVMVSVLWRSSLSETLIKILVIFYCLTQQKLLKTTLSTILMARISPLTVARPTMAAVLTEVPQPVDHRAKAVPRTKAYHRAHGAGTHSLGWVNHRDSFYLWHNA